MVELAAAYSRAGMPELAEGWYVRSMKAAWDQWNAAMKDPLSGNLDRIQVVVKGPGRIRGGVNRQACLEMSLGSPGGRAPTHQRAGQEDGLLLRSHSESHIGVAVQVLWPEGQEVTIISGFSACPAGSKASTLLSSRVREMFPCISLTVPPTPQQRALYENAITDVVQYLTDYHVGTPSVFGIDPPQGNLYQYMYGRFSQPIPAKPPGQPAPPYYVNVKIEGGNMHSAILAAGTPLRRYPQ